jgi:hypothetical protein
MKEHPILFSGPMVRAILAGEKTQTRRVITPHDSTIESAPRIYWQHGDFSKAFANHLDPRQEYLSVPAHDEPDCPTCQLYGWRDTTHRIHCRHEVGDLLWVRETWCPVDDGEDGGRWVDYRATPRYSGEHPAGWENASGYPEALKWRSSIHMPRWASRITLGVERVRVHRVQDITEEDARAEGVEPITKWAESWCEGHPESPNPSRPGGYVREHKSYVEGFRALWDSLNAARGYGWDANPWVFATTLQ